MKKVFDKVMMIALSLILLVSVPCFPAAAEENARIFVGIACAPGYEGEAEVTVTREEDGKQYTAVISQETGWCWEFPVEAGTYRADGTVISDNEEDEIFVETNKRTVEPGKVNSFAGVVGNGWDIARRAFIVQDDTIDENGRQMYYGEMSDEDVAEAVSEIKERSEAAHEAYSSGDDDSYVEPETEPGQDEPDRPEAVEDPGEGKTDTDPAHVEEERGFPVIPVLIAAAAAAAAIIIIIRKRE